MKKVLSCLLAVILTVIAYQHFHTTTIHAQASSTTRILLPWVTGSDAGYTSLVQVSNTGVDPYGTTGATGTCSVDAYYNGTHFGPGTLAMGASNSSVAYNPSSPPGGTTGIPPGQDLTFTVAQIGSATGLSLANSGQRAQMFLTCNFPYAHAQLLFVGPGGVVTFFPGYVVPQNRSMSTGPEQLLQ